MVHQGSTHQKTGFKLGGLINGTIITTHMAKTEARVRWTAMRAGLEKQRQELILSSCIKKEIVNSLHNAFSI